MLMVALTRRKELKHLHKTMVITKDVESKGPICMYYC